MASFRDKSILRSVKGKVILGFLIASLALSASWIISKLAFENMLSKLEALSTPNDKLRLVNKVFKDILLLDHLQNALPNGGEEPRKQFLKQSASLMTSLDSLSILSIDNPLQIIRIDSMKKILREREKIYGNYVDVRSKLVSNQDLSEEVKSISGLITIKKRHPENTVVKTEKKTTTTTVFTEVADTTKQAEEKKGFLKRVFGQKKQKKETEPEASKVVQKQEVKVEVDTLTFAKEDSTIDKVGEAVHQIEKSQKIRTNRFVDQEQELAVAGNTLVNQLLSVMRNVEEEVVRQSNNDTSQTQKLVTASINNIEWVMLGFFFVIVVLAYLILADITKSNDYRRQLEEAKEEAEYHSMAKQRFLSNMSHEIRTPLQSIIGYTEVLKAAEKPRQQDLETLHSASEHLLYLVNDVLDYSRIISNQFTFEKRIFAASPLLNEVIQMLRPTATAKTLLLSLENNLEDDLFLEGDPFRLRQILYNLLTNAIKFTDAGEVTLKASGSESAQGFHILFEISDTGMGMSDEQLQRVFNQFEQADPSIVRRYGGTGLGLSIVKALVEGMQGQITVKSREGVGTVFAVTVQMKRTQAPQQPQQQFVQRNYSVPGKVWLVDDDAFILKWCASVLDLHNIRNTCFSSAEEALNHPWDPEVRYVLTDMRMTGMNGAELCKRLRKVASPKVKFHVLTAQALPEEREKLLSLGFDGILMKPFHSNELLDLLDSSFPVVNKVREDLDLSQLHEMAFGDEAMIKEVLEQFVKDSRNDLDKIQFLSEAKAYNDVMELAHRLAGRIGQVGARDISTRFRMVETTIRDKNERPSQDDLYLLIQDARQLVEQVDEKIISYSI
ncbi:Sensor histidine kinase RcsC [Dyadobacter sp. CECT 9275]|uniref:histidine kinase n=1 Tax=Dyadobacter helix TaxID=2822344 RepID=A0A916N433_9BACT|nr:ATP-binding protein [Dyadobacter sp. CECT 9275]CAG4989649.1 Sensor histidine kinase RcsC [Dyadobacter sp. CECT 9275]